MKVIFRDILGNYFENEFQEDATVSDACNFLASKLEISDQQIFIVSPEDDKNFYSNNDKIKNVIDKSGEYIVFTICFNINKNEQYQSYINPPSSDSFSDQIVNPQQNQIENVIGHNVMVHKNRMIFPSKEIINTLLMLKKRKVLNPLYMEYSNIMTHVPNDLQYRVKHIAQLGYQVEDCLSALRTHRYNVQQAIHSLMALNGPPNSNNPNNHPNAKAARQQSTPIFQ